MKNKILLWGENWLQTVGLALGAGLVMYLFMCFGSNATYGGNAILEMIAVFPYYIMMAGTFSVFLVGVAYFQSYFSIFVSMNVTRKTTVISILANITLAILSILAIMVLIWKLVPNDISEGGLQLMPLFAGVMFAAAGLCVLLGTIITRWGKIGMIVFAIVCMVIGGTVGVCFALADYTKIEKLIGMLMNISEFNFWIVTAAGIVFYLLCGAFAGMATRKMEVRV